MVFRKPNFGPPPPGYIAGLGRGACGFITRGDIGPAKIGETTFNSGATKIMAPPGLSAPPGLQQQANNPEAGAGQVKIDTNQSAATQKAQQELAEQDFDDWNGY